MPIGASICVSFREQPAKNEVSCGCVPTWVGTDQKHSWIKRANRRQRLAVRRESIVLIRPPLPPTPPP